MIDKRRRHRRFLTSVRFLVRSLDLRAWNFSLALLSVIVGVSVTAMALALRADVGRKMSQELRSYGPNLIVSPEVSGAVFASPPRMSDSQARAVDRVVSPAPWAPILYATCRMGSGGLTIVGIRFGDAEKSLFSYWSVEGAWPASSSRKTRAEEPCLLGSMLARRLKVRPGDVVRLDTGVSEHVPFKVSGVVRTGESEEEQVFVPMDTLREMTGLGTVTSVLVARLEGGPEAVEEAARRINAAGIGVEARPLRQVAHAEGRLLGKLDLMMTMLSGLIFVLSGLCVMTNLISVVVEREPEIALMRSLGAGDVEIVLMLLGEATLLGLAGGVLGYCVGVLNARLVGYQLFGAAVDPRPEVLPVVVGLAVILCWLGVLPPLRRALSIQPAAVLRGE